MASAALLKLLKAAKNKNLSPAQSKKLNKQIKAQKAADAKTGAVSKPKSTYNPATSIAKRKAKSSQASNRARRRASRKKHPIATSAGEAVGKAKAKTTKLVGGAARKVRRNKARTAGAVLVGAGVVGEAYRRGRNKTKSAPAAPSKPSTPKPKRKPSKTKTQLAKKSKAYKGKFGEGLSLDKFKETAARLRKRKSSKRA